MARFRNRYAARIFCVVLAVGLVGVASGADEYGPNGEDESKTPKNLMYGSQYLPQDEYRLYKFKNFQDRQELTLQVVEAYYRVVSAEKLKDVAEQSIRALEALRNQTVEHYKAGIAHKTDVLTCEAQLAEARKGLRRAISDQEKCRANLNRLLGYPIDKSLKLDRDCKFSPMTYDMLHACVIALAYREDMRKAKVTVEEAMTFWMCPVELEAPPVGSASPEESSSEDSDRRSGKDADPDALTLLSALRKSFEAQRGKTKSPTEAAGVATISQGRKRLITRALEEVRGAYRDVKRSEGDIADDRKAVEYNSENFRINRERYREQTTSYLEVVDAQRRLAESEGRYLESLTSHCIYVARLEKTMGILGRRLRVEDRKR